MIHKVSLMSILEYKQIWCCCCRVICWHLYSDFDVLVKILYEGAGKKYFNKFPNIKITI
jgi:hypothetical protein